jgi:hypothetical protein
MMSKVGLFLFAGLLSSTVLGFADTARAQIVALGVSNVAGRGVSSSEAFPAQLEQMLAAKGYNVHVANAGVNGDTNSGMLGRLDQAVPRGPGSYCLPRSEAPTTPDDWGRATRSRILLRSLRGFAAVASRSFRSRQTASAETICRRTAFI